MLQRFSRWRAFIDPRRFAVAELQRVQADVNTTARELRELHGEYERLQSRHESVVVSLQDVQAELEEQKTENNRLSAENEVLQLKLEDLLLWVETMQARQKADAAISTARREAALNNTQPPRVTYE